MGKIDRIDMKRQTRSNTWLTIALYSPVYVVIGISSFRSSDLIIFSSSKPMPPMRPIATASMISLRFSSIEICKEKNTNLNLNIIEHGENKFDRERFEPEIYLLSPHRGRLYHHRTEWFFDDSSSKLSS